MANQPYIDKENLTLALTYKPVGNLQIYIPTPSMPIPKKSDYSKGYYYRYFFKIANNKDAKVYEISETEYNTTSAQLIYKTIKIKWKLIGSKDSATEINTNIINNADIEMSGIKSILINPIQYWKNIPDIVQQNFTT